MKKHASMKKILDLFLAAIISIFALLPMLAIAILVKYTSPGPIIFWSDRIGLNNQIFQSI